MHSLKKSKINDRYASVFRKAINAIEILGVDGMSSDETCDSDVPWPDRYSGVPKRRIRELIWRKRSVTELMQYVDDYRHHPGVMSTAGANPAKRIRMTLSSVKSERRAKSGLPHEFYSRSWLERLDSDELEELNITDSPRPATNRHSSGAMGQSSRVRAKVGREL
jgi:hypothetical protein